MKSVNQTNWNLHISNILIDQTELNREGGNEMGVAANSILPEEIVSRLYTRTMHDNENFREKENKKFDRISLFYNYRN